MAATNHIPISVVDSEESVSLDVSTAPTTPEGSLSFSPVLRAAKPTEGVEEDATGGLTAKSRNNSRSLSSTLLEGTLRPTQVRNICCVGAGYVGGPTAAVIAFQNPHIRVTVVDKDEGRIRRWNSRHAPIYEPGLRDIVRVARDGSRRFAFVNEPAKHHPASVSADNSDAISETLSTSSSECESACGDHGDATVTMPPRPPNLFFTTAVSKSISEADVVLIAVNTPTKYRGAGAGSATDMTAFEAVTAEVAQHARPGAIIVEKSTVPCRTAQLVQETLAMHRPGVHFEILSNPEFLAAGTAVNDLLYPDRVLIGSSTTASGKRAAEALAGVYASWVPRQRILTTNVWSSELAKLVANSMLAQRISSINSISAICERTGADVDEVAASIGCDPRIGDKFLKAGIGFGGSCFKKDILSLVYLAESLGLEEVGEYWRQVVKMNEYQRDRFTQRVIKCLNNTLVGKKVTVLGYAFKKDTSDTRESPALEIIKTLLDEGPREIAVFDPCCNPIVIAEEIRTLSGLPKVLRQDGGPLVVYGNVYEACYSSDAILITTEFDEFRNTKQPSVTAASASATVTSAPNGSGSSGGISGGKTLFAKPNLSRDPRPFERVEPTESDLLTLHKHLVRMHSASSGTDDPLARFRIEPDCDASCPDCKQEKESAALGVASGLATEEHRPKERVDWAKIAYHMRKPKWVFDGRGVIDHREMNKLGVRVESVGRQGRS